MASKAPPREGARRAGWRFEQLVGTRLIPQAIHNPWFEFEDRNGPGLCCPDYLLDLRSAGKGIVIIEVKLTDRESARSQIFDLYYPVLQMSYFCKIWGIIICKNLAPCSERHLVFDSLPRALAAAQPLTRGAPSIPIYHAWKL